MPTYSGDPRWILAKFPSTCSKCNGEILKSGRAFYFPNGRRVLCHKPDCGEAASRAFEAAVHDEGGY